MDNYIIYRDMPEGILDPTAPLVFMPPKDSDELFDALRIKYPHLKTHSERTREAVFDFLLQERQLEQSLSSPLILDSATTSPVQAPYPPLSSDSSPWPASFPSMSSQSSTTWSSPETLDLLTPTFGNSPQLFPQIRQLTRQESTATAVSTSTVTSPPALDQMTGVFSLSDSTQPKQRIRRKMTEAEKIEYRKRRIVKACEKCAKRKRKCQHNQPETEHAAMESNKVRILKGTTVYLNKTPLTNRCLLMFIDC